MAHRTTFAIIPARGGSKRVPRKNIRDFAGKPMIAWPIEAARSSGLFDSIIVSTDDEETARIARDHGAETPFLRPTDLSGDHVALRPVINHAITEIARLPDCKLTHVCIILATAALVTAEHLRKGHALLFDSAADFTLPAKKLDSKLFRSFTIDGNSGLNMLFPQHRLTRSQDLPEAYVDAGQFYWGKAEAFLENRPMFGESARCLVVGKSDLIDIDSEEDWHLAEQIFTARRNGASAGAV